MVRRHVLVAQNSSSYYSYSRQNIRGGDNLKSLERKKAYTSDEGNVFSKWRN